MDEQTKQLVETYNKEKKRTRRIVLSILLLAAGVAVIVTALLFRTQYPFRLENKGLLHYQYSHVLMRDITNYDYFNNEKGHSIHYYIVYRNASIYYEQETSFSVYSAHANKENVSPGITNHAVIQTAVERYTYLARDGRTYCFEKPTGQLVALFEAAYAGGYIYLRFAGYAAGIALIAAGAILIKKQRKHHEK
ncbi:MAG: hypothetical protein E7517_03245 [Ruminococcaceae bacterium]|nr:hypothetical protein [Oscillospiraceae bacterium]